jgi:hypothetical protein
MCGRRLDYANREGILASSHPAIRLHVEDRLADGEEIPQPVSISLSMVEGAVG